MSNIQKKGTNLLTFVHEIKIIHKRAAISRCTSLGPLCVYLIIIH
jgi:hypothetical protein